MNTDPSTRPRYTLATTGEGSTVVERLLTTACPTCGADWTGRGNPSPRHGSGREFLCWSCMTIHPAVEVDADGRQVQAPGAGLAREQR